MKITDLSAATGVPIPTIQFYLSNGLLPAGEPAGPAEAGHGYGDEHVSRLKLVRAMLEVGGLSIAEVQGVLHHLDAADRPVHSIFGMVTSTWRAPVRDTGDELWNAAHDDVARLVVRRSWRTEECNPAWQTLVQTIVTCRWLGQHDLLTLLDDYAETAERLADADLAVVTGRPETDGMLEGAVVWTVLGDVLISAMRRMAHESASARLFPPGDLPVEAAKKEEEQRG